MRIVFKNLVRPKKAAVLISRSSGHKLSLCQREIARATGYRDWHELECMSQETQTRHDYNLGASVFSNDEHVNVISSICDKLGTKAGDIQFAVSTARLLGVEKRNQNDILEVRRKLFEKYELPSVRKGERGAIGKLKVAGRNGEIVILKEHGSPVKVITNKTADAIVADFEFVSPRSAIPLFIPMRLYVPYGAWTEKDGSEVWFSRDYFPLWRFKMGCEPERLEPWQWIEFVSEKWFFKEGDMPWYKPDMHDEVLDMLSAAGVLGLPKLVEVLPLVVLNDAIRDFKDAVSALKSVIPKAS